MDINQVCNIFRPTQSRILYGNLWTCDHGMLHHIIFKAQKVEGNCKFHPVDPYTLHISISWMSDIET